MMDFRALELHGRSMWDHRRIEEALRVIREYGLNALVLHESDLMTEFIFPRSLFDPAAPWKGAPARRGENALHNNMAWLRDILRRAERRGVGVWVEVKELTFPDEVLERRPDLSREGTVCPTDPFWGDFVRAKYADLASLYPGLRGVIVSAGSPEGRAALSQRKCGCPRCAATSLSDWYASIIEPMRDALSRGGLGLAVREFSYNANHQRAITDAVGRQPSDVIYCIKVTPHDFYPTFPDNELIASVGARARWIEYDTMGQYYGWGVFPCLVSRDIRARFAHAIAAGVSGVLLRTEWERINDWWVLESPNRMNLRVGAVCASGASIDDRDLLGGWLEEEGARAEAGERDALAELLADSWPLMRGALYVNDFVLNDSSMFPLSVERAWWSMAEKHSLAEWFPQRAADLRLDRTKVERYLDEKKDAVGLARRWAQRLQKERRETLPGGRHAAELVLYAEGFRLVAEVCLLSAWLEQDAGAGCAPGLSEAAAGLTAYAADLRRWLDATDHRHQLAMLMNPDRAEAIAAAGTRRAAR
jgi:hypothetical protein